MADAGDLEKLPPEIRNEIYALVLVPREPLVLCNFEGDQEHLGGPTRRGYKAPRMKNTWTRSDLAKVARVGHKRNRKHIGHKRVGNKWVEVPSNVALLCVNKAVYSEAVSILYSRTRFRFVGVGTLRRFLNLIGDNIQCLRNIGMLADSWRFRAGLVEARHTLEKLAAAKNLRTFEVSHLDVCAGHGRYGREGFPGSDKLVWLCKPLLDSLKIAYKDNDLDASILEVVELGDVKSCYVRLGVLRCGCTKENANAANAEIQRRLKHDIAEQHGVEIGPQQSFE